MLADGHMSWGALLKRYRQRNGFTQVTFSEFLEVDQTTLSRWERNLTTPSLDHQRRLHRLAGLRRPSLMVAKVIERMPTLVSLVYFEPPFTRLASSYSLAAAYNMTIAEARGTVMADGHPDQHSAFRRMYEQAMDIGMHAIAFFSGCARISDSQAMNYLCLPLMLPNGRWSVRNDLTIVDADLAHEVRCMTFEKLAEQS